MLIEFFDRHHKWIYRTLVREFSQKKEKEKEKKKNNLRIPVHLESLSRFMGKMRALEFLQFLIGREFALNESIRRDPIFFESR